LERKRPRFERVESGPYLGSSLTIVPTKSVGIQTTEMTSQNPFHKAGGREWGVGVRGEREGSRESGVGVRAGEEKGGKGRCWRSEVGGRKEKAPISKNEMGPRLEGSMTTKMAA